MTVKVASQIIARFNGWPAKRARAIETDCLTGRGQRKLVDHAIAIAYKRVAEERDPVQAAMAKLNEALAVRQALLILLSELPVNPGG